jgi:tripartite-type tricarboxylate transporter receptor subunit TctC
MRPSLCLLVFLAAVAVPANRATAKDWPTKPVRFIVSQAAGGTPDINLPATNRRFAQQLCLG